MKKTLAILLSAVMMLGLLAGCGSKTTEQPSTSGTENTETAALNGISLQTTIGEVFAQLGTPSEDSESDDAFMFVWRFDDGVTIMITVTYTENSKPLRDILIDDILVTWY